jgi:hypothetical protein
MERRNLLRTILRMGNQDNALETAFWQRYVLIAASIVLILGIVLLATNYVHMYIRLTSVALIFASLAGFAIVATSIIANRYFRIWPIFVGAIVIIVLLGIGFVFFFLSLQY